MERENLMKLKKVELINKIIELQDKQISNERSCSNYELDELQSLCNSLEVQKNKLIEERECWKKKIKENSVIIDEQKELIEDLSSKSDSLEVLNENFKDELDNNATTIESLRKMTRISIIVAVIAVAATIMVVVI